MGGGLKGNAGKASWLALGSGDSLVAMTVPAEPSEGPERLEVRLSANASPKRVAELATMFDEVIAELHVAEAAEITLVVKNRATRAELRGWNADGKSAVRDVTAIVSNPMRAVQEDHRRAAAARVIATHGRRLAAFQPRFYQAGHAIATVDEVFIETMEALGRTSRPAAPSGSVFGDTVAFVTVLRVGRSSEGKPVCARMRLEGSLHDVEIPESQAARLHTAAQTGQVLSVNLLCEWKQQATGLELVGARVTGVDPTFRPSSGADLLRDIATSPLPFTRSDYQEALRSLGGDEES